MHTSTQNQTDVRSASSNQLTTFKKLVSYVVLMMMVMVWSNVNSQVSTYYNATKSSSGTYTPITGGTVFVNSSSASMDDVTSAAIPLPSSFTYNGITVDSIYINTNGFIVLSKTPNNTQPVGYTYSPISLGTTYPGVISVYGNDMDKSTLSGTAPEISYKQEGSDFIIQYQDIAPYGYGSYFKLNAQIRLNLCNGVVKIAYGTASASTYSLSGQVGIRGSNNSDYLNWTLSSGVWTSSATAGGSNTATMTFSTSCLPTSGGSFTYTPASGSAKSLSAISYNTSTVAGVAPGSNANHLIRLDFDVTGLTGTLILDSIGVTSLNTNDADITAVKLYRTTTGIFSTGNQLGSSTTFSSGIASFNGLNLDLACGTNYIWLAYDISSSATSGTLDAKFVANSIKVGSSYYPSTQKSPAGSRSITSPMTFTSATATQANTLFVQKGQISQQVIGMTVNMSNTGAPISIDSLILNTTGTNGTNNNTTNIQNARVYYCGNTNVFSTSTTYGSVITAPNGTMKFNGYQPLLNGANYFFLAYDIKSTATTNDSVDASFTGLTVGGTNQSVTNGNPTGYRVIRPAYCIPTNYYQCCGFGITNVTLGSINNTTTPETGNNAYHNYMNMSTDLQKGSSQTMSVTPGTYGYYQNIAAWIDWNGDGDFSDTGEKLGEQTNLATATAYDYNFSVPCSAATGQTVMRLRHEYYTTNLDPCNAGGYLDIEDYTVNITDSPFVYITSLSTQPNLADVQTGTAAMILRLPVILGGCSGSQALTSVNFSTSGSSNASGDIDSAVLYYTGNTGTYSASNRFGVAASPSGSFTINGSRSMIADTNNFWLVYFVKGSATIGNVIDAQVSQITLNGSANQTPTVTSPSGNRTINTAMTLVSATAVQASTAAVVKNSADNKMIRLDVDMSTGYSINLTQIKFNLVGSTSISGDITNAKIFFTGTSNVFATTTQFGSTLTSGLTSNPITMNGTAALSTGTNYFWLTATVKATATAGDSIDGQITQVNVGGLNNTTVSNPAGKRRIINTYCNPAWSYVQNVGITNVNIGSINNTTTSGITTANYTNLSTQIQRNTTQTLNFTTGTYDYYNNVSAWIDFNQNATFDATDKIGDQFFGGSGSPQTGAFNFFVPCNASLGETRLRIINEYYCCSAPSSGIACGGLYYNYYGEAEDYTVEITDMPQVYNSSEALTSSTAAISPGSNNNQIIKVQVVTSGCTGPLTLTDLNLNTAGSSDPSSDIDSIKVYFTGNSANFATTTLYAATGSQNGSYTVNGSVDLLSDTNYFHVVYKINSSATLGDVVDAQCASIVINGTTQYPSITSPSGNRTILSTMTFVSATVAQPNTAKVAKGSSNNMIMQVVVNMSAGTSATADSLSFSSTGSSSLSDFQNMRLYTTGTSSTFSTASLLSTVSSAATTFKMFAGNGLSQGANYYWLTYDITTGATTGNVVDAVLNYVKIGGTSNTPGTGTATGSRQIIPAYCVASWSYAPGTPIGITRVQLGSIDNSSTAPSSTAGTTVNYTNLSTNLTRASNQTISIDLGSYGYYQNPSVHIDYNQDGTFQTSERVADEYLATQGGTYQYSFKVPCSAALGSTRMRVINEYMCCSAPGTGGLACGGIYYNYYGEAEDYTVNILDSAMTVAAVTTQQVNTTTVSSGGSNSEIGRVRIITNGCTGPQTLTSLSLSTAGSTSASDITAAKVYFTGNSSTLSFGTQFGSSVSNPSGSFSVTGSQNLVTDTNYFFVTYDISSGATNGNVVDVQCSQTTVSSTNYTPATTSPSGSRTIAGPMSYSSQSWSKNTSSVQRSSSNNVIVTVAVVMGAGASINMDSLVFNTNGSQNPSSNIASAKVYYTGTSATFATTTQFGSTISTPSGSMGFGGTAALQTGTNYFHLSYNMSASANYSTPDSVTADFTRSVVAGTSNNASPSTLTGKRKIIDLSCTPTFNYNYSGYDHGITNVTLGSINNTTATNGQVSNAYTDYSATLSTNIKKSQTYTISIKPDNNYNTNVWVYIDWNQNGTYDASEAVVNAQSATAGTANTYTFSVPCNAVNGTARMRVIEDQYNYKQYGTYYWPSEGCPQNTYGEAEDYSVNIQDSTRSVLSSVNAHPTTVPVSQGATNVQIQQVKVMLAGCSPSFSATNISFDASGTQGTTSLSDIANAKAYYTTTATFATTSQFGSTITSPSSSTLSFTGSQTLPDSSWLWLVYNVSATATIGDYLDAKVNSLTINGSSYTPSNANPTGSVLIDNPMTYVSSTVTMPNTSNVTKGFLRAPLVRVEVTMSSTGYPIPLSNLYATFTGSQNITTNLSNARIYYTGSSATFSTTTQFGATVTSGYTGTLSFSSSSVNMANGVNYFWLTGDVSTSANTNDSLSGTIDSIKTAGTTYVPSPTSVSTKRKIIDDYCVPFWYYTYSGFGIKNVSIGSINNTTSTDNSNVANFLSQSTTLQKSASASVTIKNGTYGYDVLGVFIDWNQDGDFGDVNEMIGSNSSYTANRTVTFNFTVPCGATLGTTRMRVIEEYDGGAGATANPCGGAYYNYYGEAEDYSIDVTDFPRSVTGVTTTQASTNSLGTNSTNNVILRVRAATGGCSGTVNVSQLDFNTAGSSNASTDISNAKVFYTGSSNVYATTTQFGSTSSPSGAFSVTGSQNLTTDSAFFWLAYDIPSSATLNNVVDATGTVMTVNAATIGTSTAPSGDRMIADQMAYVSSTTAQPNTGIVYKSTLKNEILRIGVVMSVGTASIMKSMDFTTAGTTNSAVDISSAKLYYTGTSSTFATTTLVGSASSPSYGFTINGNQSLQTGTNYFWMTYDVTGSAAIGDTLDGTCENIQIDSAGTLLDYIPSVTDPAGYRRIIPAYCSPTWLYGLGAEMGITQVTLGSISNSTSAPSSSAGTTSSYTNLSTNIQRNSSQSMTVVTGTYGYYQNLSVHIDYNQDGTFQTSERVFDQYYGGSGAANTANFNFTVPCNANLGSTRMRVINEYICCAAPSTGGLACGGIYYSYYGEAEDYTVNVTDSVISYYSSTTEQPITTDVFANSSDKEIARLAIVLKGCSGSKVLTNLTLNTNGSSNASNDISNAKVYFTGSNRNFATTTTFGSTSNPSGSFTVSGSQALSSDTNFFWVAYDIMSGATTNNYIDVEVTDMTISAATYSPTVSAPSGNRMINVPMTYNSSEVSMASTNNVTKKSKSAPILKLVVNMSTGAALNLTQFQINTTGSTNIGADVDTVRVYSTGTSNTFSTTNMIGSFVGTLTSTFNVNPTHILVSGDNYFWVTHSVKSSATTGDSLTGGVSQITINGSNYTPTNNVSGKRRIIPAYCNALYSYTYPGMQITRVKVGTIDNINTTQPTVSPYYTDYTNISTDLQVGVSNTFVCAVGTYSGQSLAAWIDYNQDGDYTDSGEKLGEVASMPTGNTTTTTFNFTIPNSATLGNTRMRVRSGYFNSGMTPCATYNYGETEEYTINVTAPPAPTPSITPSTSTSFCQSIGQVFSTTLNSSYAYVWKVNGSTVYSGTGSPYHQYSFNPGSTGSYTVQVFVTDAFAQTGSSSSIAVTVNANPVGGTATAASPSICAGDNDTLTVTGNSGSIQWQSKVGTGAWVNITVNGTSSTYIATPSVTTQYRCASTLGSCGTAYSNAVTVSIGSTFVWGGNTSTAWTNAANWCNGTVPTASAIVVIPVRTNMPVLASGGTCSTLTINTGASLTLNTGANLIVNGLMTNNGTLNHNGGVLNLNSPQNVPGGNYFYLKLTGTSGEYKFRGNATINNNFEIGSGATVNDSGFTISVVRDIINNGTHKGNGTIKTISTGTYQTASGTGIYGNFEVANGSTTGVRFTANTTINKLLKLTSGTAIVYNGTTLTVGSNSTSTGNITFGTGTQILGANSASNSLLQILGNSSAPAITGFNFVSPGSLNINRPNGIRLAALCKVGSTLTVSAGKLRMNGFNLYVGQTNTANGFINTSGTGKISNASTTAGWLYIYGTSASAGQITNLLIDSMYNMSVMYPQGVALGNSFRLTNTLQLPGNGGSLDLNGYTLTMSSTASLSEVNHNLIYGSSGFITTTRSYTAALSNNNIAGLGIVLTTNQSPGNTTIVRGHTLSSQSSQNSVSRYFTLQPSNHTGLVYNTIEFRYDSVECGTGLTTPGRHVIAKNTAAGATSGWTRIAGNARANTLGAPYGYQFVVSKNMAGAASQVITVFDSVSAGLSSIIAVTPAANNDVTNINDVNVWPNPFTTNLNMGYTVDADANVTINMMDMSGKLVSTQTLKAQKGYNNLSINGSELPAGMYLINLIQNNEVKTFRVVKTN